MAASCLRESVAKSKQAQGQDAKIEAQDAKIENRDTKIEIHDIKNDTQNARITDLETDLGTTQIELRHLKAASDAYLAIRNLVLAEHATVKADTKIKSVPQTVFNSSQVFMDRLESGGWRTDQLQVESAPEAQAYISFQGESDAIKSNLYKRKD